MADKSVDGLLPTEWLPFFVKANIRNKELADTPNAKGKSVLIGRFLSPNVGRIVPFEVKGRSGRAVLRVREGRANTKRYYFEVAWDDSGEESTPPAPPITATPTKLAAAPSAVKAKTAKKSVAAKQELSAPKPTRKQSATPTTPPAKGPTSGNDEAW